MKILVTGGTGVVGTAAVPALLENGHAVRLLSRHADHDARRFPKGVESFEADIGGTDSLREAVEGCDAVLHIAGISDEEPPEITFEKVNVEGTRRLLAACAEAGAPHFIFLSSLGADRGQSAYHQSKLRAEEAVRGYVGSWTILRPGNVYGPGDETISMLLKMLRSLPAVPMVARGDQPFQPIWYDDLGQVLAQAVARRDLAGRTLSLAGPDVTTTEEVLRLLSGITGLDRPRLSVPVWLTEIGVHALEAFGASGKKWLRQAGLGMPLSPAKLEMLLEVNVIGPSEENALSEFVRNPTPLQEGLAMLAELLPEQLPGDGVGSIRQSTYSADIVNSNYSATELLAQVCDRLADVMPIEFAAEPGAPENTDEGNTFTAEIAGRGHVQVRLEERTPTRATFVTLEGHPLAGVMQLHTEDVPAGVRFNVHIAAQPANVLDWIAMRTIGASMQRANWRSVVRRVVDLSGGHAPAGVQQSSHAMDSAEARDIRRFADRIVLRRERAEHDASIAGNPAPTSTRA